MSLSAMESKINKLFPDFDYHTYFEYNKDVQSLTKAQILSHFFSFGQYENRVYKRSSSQDIYETFDTYNSMNDDEKKHHVNRIDYVIKNNISNLFYYYKLLDFCNEYKCTIDQVMNERNTAFTYLCYRYTEQIRKFPLSISSSSNENEKKYIAVLVENEDQDKPLSHIEFLIRNTILKLSSEWSHVIICNDNNYDAMIKICSNISLNINVLKNIDPNTLNADKLLIYHSDTCLLNSNIIKGDDKIITIPNLDDDWKTLMFKNVVKRIAIVIRPNYLKFWGGDVINAQSFKRGLEHNGYIVDLVTMTDHVMDYDHIFLTNVTLPGNGIHCEKLNKANKIYGIMALHEDTFKYPYVFSTFVKIFSIPLPTIIEEIINNPIYVDLHTNMEMIHNNYMKKYIMFSDNYTIYDNANIIVTESKTEETSIREGTEKENLNIKTIHLAAGLSENWSNIADDSFLKLTGLTSNNYLIQVGRIESRKNQIATILACRDIPLPLVFVVAGIHERLYDEIVYYLIKKFRKHRTIILTPFVAPSVDGSLEFIPMPNGRRLDENVLQSAYHHARLSVHPAFLELPGYTILESIKCGTPCVASEWCTVNDYFEYFDGDKTLGGNIDYALPYDINGITEAVNRMLEKPINKNIYSNIFKRTSNDMGKELAEYLQQI